jgi:hypothetical protein
MVDKSTAFVSSSYVVFGKKDNTNAVNLSSVVSGSGGFVINGEGTFAGRSHHQPSHH